MFFLDIKKDSFRFMPSLFYPGGDGTRPYCQVTKQKLILNRRTFKPGEVVMGNVDAEFEETQQDRLGKTKKIKHYFKGYIKAIVGAETPLTL